MAFARLETKTNGNHIFNVRYITRIAEVEENLKIEYDGNKRFEVPLEDIENLIFFYRDCKHE